MDSDERLGLPSCSNFDRYAACPGSYILERECEPLPEGEWTQSGTRIHDAMAGKPVELNHDEVEIADAIEQLESTVDHAVGVPDEKVVDSREVRLWIGDRDYTPGSKIASGKPDRIQSWFTERNELHACIRDYKTGRLDVEPAPGNAQLRGLVAAFAYNYSPQKVWVAIVGPFQKEKASIAVYDSSAILRAQVETWELITKINKPDAPRSPGEHCRYCRAKAICPELQAFAVAAPRQLGVATAEAKTQVQDAVKQVSDDKLALLLEGLQLRQWANEAIRDEAKRRLKDGRTLNGWQLGEGEKREKITDVGTVLGRMLEWCDVQEFQSKCSITKEALADIVREKRKLKGKALKQEVKTLIDGCTTETVTEGSLERVKKQIE